VQLNLAPTLHLTKLFPIPKAAFFNILFICANGMIRTLDLMMMSQVFYRCVFTLFLIKRQSQEILGIAIPEETIRRKQAVLGHFANLPFYLQLHKAQAHNLTKTVT
jgi:hypothetical protein